MVRAFNPSLTLFLNLTPRSLHFYTLTAGAVVAGLCEGGVGQCERCRCGGVASGLDGTEGLRGGRGTRPASRRTLVELGGEGCGQ